MAAAAVAAITREAFGRAMSDVEDHMRGGAVLRGEVYARWQEAITSGDMDRAVHTAEEPSRARAGTALTPADALQVAIAGALAALVVEVDLAAAEEAESRWWAELAGRELLAADESLGRPWPGFADAAHNLVHGWQIWLRTQVRAQAPPVRTRTRAYGTGATVLLATIAAVAPPADEITGSSAASTVLRAVLANPVAASLGDRARAEFLVRVGDLLAAEVDRRMAAISRFGIDPGLAARLRDSATEVGVARHHVPALSEAA
jgi:hypothetical protein